MSKVDFEYENMSIPIIVFKVDFDRKVYLSNNDNILSIANPALRTFDLQLGIPKSVVYGHGIFYLTKILYR